VSCCGSVTPAALVRSRREIVEGIKVAASLGLDVREIEYAIPS
jgi:hypothetical protein